MVDQGEREPMLTHLHCYHLIALLQSFLSHVAYRRIPWRAPGRVILMAFAPYCTPSTRPRCHHQQKEVAEEG